MKHCPKCQTDKEQIEFHKNSARHDGLHSYCKPCVRAYNRIKSRERYRQDPTKDLERAKKWNRENRDKKIRHHQIEAWQNKLLNSARASASRKGLEFSLTKGDIELIWVEQQGKCYWLNIPMIPSTKPRDLYQPSLDRLNRDQGYTKSNVVLTCYAANAGRNQSSIEDWTKFLGLIKESI